MSIVLDALRKAEAERARGEVPGLHSAIGPAAVPLPASPAPGLPWQGVAIGAGALLALVGLVLGAGAWWRWVQADVATPEVTRSSSTGPSGTAGPTARPAPGAINPSAAVMPAPLIQVPQPAPALPASTVLAPTARSVAPATAATAATATPSAANAAEARPAAPAVRTAASGSGSGSAGSAAAAAAVAANASAATPAPTAAPATATPPDDGRPVALADLPEEIRRELPPLSVGGLIQMDDPPRRSLIINGAIVMEGEAIQPGLLLERIGNGQATLRYKGWRVLLGI